jgi:pyruvate dehydrogenase E2 component (dihydrolipoamide acetyltransferase)
MDVLMPQLGETVAEGKITTWYKKVGDSVAPGDNLFEIETDKVSMEVPAIAGGVLSEIRVGAGETAPVGTIVAVISASGETVQATKAAPATTPGDAPRSPLVPAKAGIDSPAEMDSRLRGNERRLDAAPSIPGAPLDPFREVRTPERNFGPARTAGGIAATPLARRMAGENAIDLSRIKGSGPHGRITACDVEAALGRAARAGAAPSPSAADIRALYKDVAFEEVPLDGMRRTIAARLSRAVQTIPHFYLTSDCVIDGLLQLREQANAAAPTRDGEPAFRLSLNDFVIKALALALQRVPAANAVWADDRILRFRHSDIGVAVTLDGGLITPVIRGAEAKSVSAISKDMRDLAERARAKKLMPHEYQGGASAVSNLGMYGVREFAAIINPPHATILAVGAAQRRPIENLDGTVRFASQITVTLSCDHRVVDGALGAQLLDAFKNLIEQPVQMLV